MKTDRPANLSTRFDARTPQPHTLECTGMDQPVTLDEYRVRFPTPDGQAVEVRGTVDRTGKTVTYELPDHTRTTVDVVTARALQMILSESVFGSLHPSGPHLRVEKINSSLGPTDPPRDDKS